MLRVAAASALTAGVGCLLACATRPYAVKEYVIQNARRARMAGARLELDAPLDSPVMWKSRKELGGLRVLALQETAIREGVDRVAVEDALESEDPRGALIELIIEERRLNVMHTVMTEDEGAVALRRELKGMRVIALVEHARAHGVDSGRLENAMDSADPKSALISLVTVAAKHSGGQLSAPLSPRADAARADAAAAPASQPLYGARTSPVSEVSSAGAWTVRTPTPMVAEWKALKNDGASPVWTPDRASAERDDDSRAGSVSSVPEDQPAWMSPPNVLNRSVSDPELDLASPEREDSVDGQQSMEELQQQVASLSSQLLDTRLSLSTASDAAHAIADQKNARKAFLLETANVELEKRAEEVTELQASVSELEAEAEAQAARVETLSTELASAQSLSAPENGGAPARNMLERLQQRQAEMDLLGQELSGARNEIEMLREQSVSAGANAAEAEANAAVAMAALRAELAAAREEAAEEALALELSQSTEAASVDAREQSEADTKQVELALGRLQAEESAAVKRHQREVKALRLEAEEMRAELAEVAEELAATQEAAQRKTTELEDALEHSGAHVEKLFGQVEASAGKKVRAHSPAADAAQTRALRRPELEPEPEPANDGELDFDQFRAAMRKAVRATTEGE